MASFAWLCLCLSSTVAFINYQDLFSKLSGWLWLLALLLLIVAIVLHDRSTIWPQSWQPAKVDWLMITGLTLVAFALRVYRLDGFLPGFHGDEGEMGMLAL